MQKKSRGLTTTAAAIRNAEATTIKAIPTAFNLELLPLSLGLIN
jgi:hypothetical protein